MELKKLLLLVYILFDILMWTFPLLFSQYTPLDNLLIAISYLTSDFILFIISIVGIKLLSKNQIGIAIDRFRRDKLE